MCSSFPYFHEIMTNLSVFSKSPDINLYCLYWLVKQTIHHHCGLKQILTCLFLLKLVFLRGADRHGFAESCGIFIFINPIYHFS